MEETVEEEEGEKKRSKQKQMEKRFQDVQKKTLVFETEKKNAQEKWFTNLSAHLLNQKATFSAWKGEVIKHGQ